MSESPLIQVRALCKRFGQQVVLDHLDLDIQRGEALVVVGRSGTGKSVLLKHLIGLVRPDSGQVCIAGTDLHQARGQALYRLRERFGMMFQGGALFDSLTVTENIAFPLREKTPLSALEIAQTVADLLKSVGLEGVETKYPAQLSGGMRKRVALARALAHRPEIMLFDEPTTGLDPVLVGAIHHLIANTRQRYGYTAVIVSHEIPRIFAIASRVAMLHGGAIIAIAPPEEFVQSPDPIVQQFITGRLEGPLTAS